MALLRLHRVTGASALETMEGVNEIMSRVR